MSKTVVETEGSQMTSQYGADALNAGQARLHARSRAHAHAHAPNHPRARAHTHRQICNTFCFSTATMIRELASMLRLMYIACLVAE